MIGFLLVALGGAVGAMARYGTGLAVVHHGGVEGFWATLIVNVLGSGIMGVLAAFLAGRSAGGDQALWLLVGVGFLGAFTTFSSFSKDAVDLLMDGQTVRAVVYMTANLAGSIGAFAGLFAMMRGVWA